MVLPVRDEKICSIAVLFYIFIINFYPSDTLFFCLLANIFLHFTIKAMLKKCFLLIKLL